MKCKHCGGEEFVAHQMCRMDVLVDGSGTFIANVHENPAIDIYDSERPYGPFQCTGCGAEYEELDGSDSTSGPIPNWKRKDEQKEPKQEENDNFFNKVLKAMYRIYVAGAKELNLGDIATFEEFSLFSIGNKNRIFLGIVDGVDDKDVEYCADPEQLQFAACIDDKPFKVAKFASQEDMLEALNDLEPDDMYAFAKYAPGMVTMMACVWNGAKEIVEYGDIAVKRRQFRLNEELVAMTKNNKPEGMLRLIRDGADVNYVDTTGTPVLMWATNHANSHTIELLVEHGADVNAQRRSSGMTKLMQVASYGNADIVSYLLKHGANICLQDQNGEDALSYAKRLHMRFPVCDETVAERERYEAVISMLESAMRCQNTESHSDTSEKE